MKRVTLRPGKVVVVSDEALARARQSLKTFGVTASDLDRLAAFKGDVAIGACRRAGRVVTQAEQSAKLAPPKPGTRTATKRVCAALATKSRSA